MLSDSILSFNTIHDRLKRCETAGLRDGTWVGYELATQAGLDIQSPGFARDLFTANADILDNAMELAHRPFPLPNGVFRNRGDLRFEDVSFQGQCTLLRSGSTSRGGLRRPQ